MKTSEMIKTIEMIEELIDNPKLKFEAIGCCGGKVIARTAEVFKDQRNRTHYGVLVLDSDSETNILPLNNITLSYKWEPVRETVTFMEAVNSGKRIKYEDWSSFYDLYDALGIVKEKERCISVNTFNGKWYIE